MNKKKIVNNFNRIAHFNMEILRKFEKKNIFEIIKMFERIIRRMQTEVQC